MKSKDKSGEKTIGKLVAGVTGLAVGAAATATAVALSNKKTRAKFAKTINDAEKQGKNAISAMRKLGIRAKRLVDREKARAKSSSSR